MPSFKVQVYRGRVLGDSFSIEENVTVTRLDASQGDPLPISLHRGASGLRLIIAPLHAVSIPRNWFEISSPRSGVITLRNLHAAVAIPIIHESPVAPLESRTFEHELLIDAGAEIALRIEATVDAPSEEDPFHSLQSIPPTPGQDPLITQMKSIHDFDSKDGDSIAKMLRIALQVVQKAAGSDAFFQAATIAAVEIVNLDRTLLLLREEQTDAHVNKASVALGNGWSVIAEANKHKSAGNASPSLGTRVSSTLINRVLHEQGTVLLDPLRRLLSSSKATEGPSLDQVECAVASPILNASREVIGMLYGDRKARVSSTSTSGINDLEATLVEILAGAVAGGMARLAEERFRNRLSEFFSPKVAAMLATDPSLMEGQDVEVSVLFCDIRGFSTVTEKLGPRKAIEWINDVMSELSQCVIDRDGVLVDYVGDELMAMFGAPGNQPDHADRAIQTALAMMQAIERLRVRWGDVLPRRFGAGIGVNTGPARVGNVGSRQKFKYGALGNTVNVGSRLQSATKQLGVDCLVSETTLQAVTPRTNARRVANLAVVGIEQPLGVYEMVVEATSQWSQYKQVYEQALALFESGHLQAAKDLLQTMAGDVQSDAPTVQLGERIQAALAATDQPLDTVWRLTEK